jgi:hypothetical protein
MLPNFVKTDSPKCETESANRTLQTGSLILSAGGYNIIIQQEVDSKEDN